MGSKKSKRPHYESKCLQCVEDDVHESATQTCAGQKNDCSLSSGVRITLYTRLMCGCVHNAVHNVCVCCVVDDGQEVGTTRGKREGGHVIVTVSDKGSWFLHQLELFSVSVQTSCII